jgi:hypothetical protein
MSGLGALQAYPEKVRVKIYHPFLGWQATPILFHISINWLHIKTVEYQSISIKGKSITENPESTLNRENVPYLPPFLLVLPVTK